MSLHLSSPRKKRDLKGDIVCKRVEVLIPERSVGAVVWQVRQAGEGLCAASPSGLVAREDLLGLRACDAQGGGGGER